MFQVAPVIAMSCAIAVAANSAVITNTFSIFIAFFTSLFVIEGSQCCY